MFRTSAKKTHRYDRVMSQRGFSMSASRGGPPPEYGFNPNIRENEDVITPQLQLQAREIMELRNAMQRCDAALQHERNEHQHSRKLLDEAEQHARQQVGEMTDRVRILQEGHFFLSFVLDLVCFRNPSQRL